MRQTILVAIFQTIMISGFGQKIGSYEYYQQRISELPDIIQMAPAKGKTEKGKPVEEQVREGNTFFLKRSASYNLEQGLKDWVLFNPNLDVIFPGALVRKSSIIAGSPALINVPRNNVDIWVNISHSDSIGAKEINPNAIDVNTAINQILQKNNKGYAAGISFTYSNLYSLQQSLLELGLTAEWLTGDLSSKLIEKKSIENNVVLVKFTQAYYTSSYSLPEDGNEYIFKRKLSLATSDNVFNKSDPPCYISSVTYGRMLLFKIESKKSYEEIRASLNVVNDFFIGKVDANTAYNSLSNLNQSEITVIVKGGSNEDGVKVITTKDFMDFIKSNPTVSSTSPGVPISFVVKDIKGNNLVQLVRATDFNEYNIHALKRQIRVTILNLKIHNDGDSGFEGAGDFTWTININGKPISVQGSELTLSTGSDHRIDKADVFTLLYTTTDKLELEAEIIERDGGPLSGADDVVPKISKTIWATDFDSNSRIPFSSRPAKDSDPDVELFVLFELISTFYDK